MTEIHTFLDESLCALALQAAQAVNAYNQQGGGLQEKQMAQAVLFEEGLAVSAKTNIKVYQWV